MSSRMTLIQVSERTGVDRRRITTYIEREWIAPGEGALLDEEDVARILLIEELQRDFGANEEAVPLILHLLDQLYFLREKLRREGSQRAAGL